MRELDVSNITTAVKEMVISANYHLSPDMKKALDDNALSEKSPLGKSILTQLQKNLEIADTDKIPICQDTGMAVVFIKVGQEVHLVGGSVTDAINEGRKICFQYFEFNGAKEKILRREGTKYSVSPYALVWDDNHYYMIGFSDTRQMMVNFRVDRMCSTELTNERAVPLPAGFDMAEYVQHQFRMFAGDEIDVVLECRDDMMKYIIDQFGEEVETWPAAEGAFYAKVSVADSPTFYGWVFPFEGKVRIKSPLEIREKYRKMVSAAAQEQP